MIQKLLLSSFFLGGCYLSNGQTKDLVRTTSNKVFTTEITEEDQLSIYPNPASSFIEINNTFKTDVELRVYNIIGDVVISKNITSGSEEIDISQLASGIYILAYDNGKELETVRLLKI